MNSPILKSLESARRLEFYCGHDLRGSLGRAQSVASLLQEDVALSPQQKELVQMASEALAETFEKLDANLNECDLKTHYVWVLDESISAPFAELHESHDMVVKYFKSLGELKSARELYRPTALLIALSNDPNLSQVRSTVDNLTSIVGEGLTRITLVHSSAFRIPDLSTLNTSVLTYEKSIHEVFKNLTRC